MTYPRMLLDVAALEHNVAVMAAWCAERGVGLAPHVKTTMSAPIVERQAAAGAEAFTVATVEQAQIVHSWGHRRILIANEVIDAAALTRLRTLLEHDPSAEIACFADSPAGVRIAGEAFAGAARPLPLLVDVGAPGGRSGVRDARQARELALAIADHPALRLVGVAGYEGVLGNDRSEATLAAVDEYCGRVGDIFLATAGLFECDRPILSMGGSVFPDRVVAALPAGTLLRCGCYVTHDHGRYAEAGPQLGLVAAATVRALVLSVPEPGIAVVGAGKRELPHDAGLPTVLDRPGTVTAMYDHHTVVAGATGVRVADVVEFGISHPCSLFARWPAFQVTRDGRHTDMWRTQFHLT
jgi:D-serine deaminase-like pyridoxal phosphate-dependent protein